LTIVTVLGAGRMGTAVTWPLRDNGHEVRLVGTHLDRDTIRSCRDHQFHPGLRRRIPDGLRTYFLEELPRALEGADVIVSGVNSLGVHWIGQTLGPLLWPGATILSLTKGLETGPDGVLRILPDVLRSELPAVLREQVQICAVAGPVLAYELSGRRISATVFCGSNRDELLRLRGIFNNDYYRVWLSTDATGVEVFSALKNALTIGIGAARGMLEAAEAQPGGRDEINAAMHNTAALLFAAASRELSQLVKIMGGCPEGFAGLQGAGDLYVTCTGGRTFRLGWLLGRGQTYSQAKAEMCEDTLEGAFAVQQMAKVLPVWESEGRVGPDDLPLLRAIACAIMTDTPLAVPWGDLMGVGELFV
jgi:glycerol-3-phosphate dehydrogenase (NAD(P)+)